MGKYVKQSLILFTIMSFMLFGCGGTQAEDAQNSEPQEPEVVNDVEETVKETPTAKEMEETEEETTEEKTTEEETTTNMTEAQVTTTAMEAGGLLAYMDSLDPQYPSIIIYNESDGGTIVNIQEGQHYSLKKGDKIIVNECWDVISSSAFDTNIVSNEFDVISNNAVIIYPDYTKFDKNQKFFYSFRLKSNTDEEPRTITCYLDAPTE